MDGCNKGTRLEMIKEHCKQQLTSELLKKDWRGRYYRLTAENRVD